MIILKAYAGGSHHGVPVLVNHAGIVHKVILLHVFHGIYFHELHEDESAHKTTNYFTYYRFSRRRFQYYFSLAAVEISLKKKKTTQLIVI